MTGSHERGRLRTSAALSALLSLGWLSGAFAGEVEILRDTDGVPHIYAGSRTDAAYALAWAQAEDNLPDILRFVTEARGRAAEAFGGEGAIASDLLIRQFGLPPIADRLYAETDPDQRAEQEAFAAGINAWLTAHPEQKPAWFDRMTGLDLTRLSKFYQVSQQVQGTARAELRRGLGRAPAAEADPGGQSNMWVVAPSRTKGGETFLVADPHLPWSGRTRWWEHQVTIGERWSYGAAFFGSLWPGIGFTQDLAWASTNNAPDNADVYRIRLHPEDDGLYFFEGDWRPVIQRTETIAVKGEPSREVVIRATHHGPIVHEDRARRQAYAVRVAGLEAVDLGRLARPYFEARDVHDMHRSNRFGDHYMWHRTGADRHGNIAYFFFLAVNERDDAFNWSLPVDGSIAATEWGPPIAWDALPVMINPPSGWIQNCNNSAYTSTERSPLRPEDFPAHLAGTSTRLSPWSRGYRASEQLAANGALEFSDMLAMARDVKAVAAPRYIAALEEAYADDPPRGDAARALDILRAWDLEASLENVATPILTTFVEVAGPIEVIGRLAPSERRARFEEALALMTARWGGIAIPQARVHGSLRGDLFTPLPGAGNESARNPFVTLFMGHARRLQGDRWIADGGSSWQMAVRYWRGGVEARTLLPYGNSEDPASPHYDDQAALFASGAFKTARLTRAEVEEALESRITLTAP
ncbi:MAG: penicillin acylase family protein [Alphaproteobacteria bacterium]|nr:penicillin acylase family protein [Alphaproteobacteria bacterium]